MIRLNKIIKLIFFFSGIVFFYACSERKNNTIDETEAQVVISIQPGSASEVRYSQLFSYADYFPLPTSKDFLIGSVDKLIHQDDFFVIMDRTITNSVFVYDTKNNRTIQINKTGAGPEEYISMRDIFYNRETGEMGIFCKMRRKLLFYSPEGDFLRSEQLPFYMERLSPLQGGYALFSDYTFSSELNKRNLAPNIVLLEENKARHTAHFFRKGINKSIVWTSQPDFSRVGKNTYSIKPDHCNVVYHVTSDSIYPAFFLDFGPYNVDAHYWDETEKRHMTLEKADEFCYNSGLCESYNVLEDKDYLFFNYKHKKDIYSVFYSKKTGRLIHTSSVINDMDQITAFYPLRLQENKLYCLLNTEDIRSAEDFLTDGNLLPEFVLKNVEDFDNPVIVVFTLKPF